MVVNVAGFGYSGGTAVALLLKEYGYEFKEGKECKEIDFPMGVFTLESLLFDTPSLTQNTTAVDCFLKMAQNTLYFDRIVSNLEFNKKYFDEIMQMYSDFVGAISNLESKGIRYSSYSNIYSSALNQWNVKILKLFGFHNGGSFKNRIWHYYLDKAIKRGKQKCAEIGNFYIKVSREEYVQEAAKLIKKILDVKFEGKNAVAQNMIVPGHTNRRDYFSETQIKSIIVYRDPRDQYIKLKKAKKVINVESFISLYKRNIEIYGENTDMTLIVRLEDLIFSTEKTEKMIIDFLGVNREEKQKEVFFVPEESAKMTRDFIKESYQTEEMQSDIRIIEKELSEYLYDFS